MFGSIFGNELMSQQALCSAEALYWQQQQAQQLGMGQIGGMQQAAMPQPSPVINPDERLLVLLTEE